MDVDLLRSALPPVPDPDLALLVRRPFVREAVLEALRAARSRPAFASPVLARWFREARRLGSRDRRAASEAVYGVVRHEHLLVRAGAWDDEARVDRWCDLVAGERFADVAPASPAEDLATALSIPYPLARQWIEALGPAEAAQLSAALSERAPVTVRANRLVCTREELARRLAEEGVATRPTARAPDGLHVEGRANLNALASFREGWFEVQDEASQLLVAAVPLPGPGTPVVDLCAGAGGKSLALAARGARVLAYDVREQPLQRLEKRAERAGAEVTLGEPEPAPVVLVDAPCSGTGRLRRDPALRWGLELGALVDLQREILAEAAELVLPGGALVYATCSLDQDENSHQPPGEWQLVDKQWLWPHRTGTDGFAWRTWRRP